MGIIFGQLEWIDQDAQAQAELLSSVSLYNHRWGRICPTHLTVAVC